MHASRLEREEALAETVDGLKALAGELGGAPTVRELAARLGIGVSATHGRLEILKARGIVTWLPGCPRTLRVVPRPGERCPWCGCDGHPSATLDDAEDAEELPAPMARLSDLMRQLNRLSVPRPEAGS